MALKSNCKTLPKVADDEEIFVLRAQDATAPAAILHWIGMNLYCSDEKLREAFECALRMKRFPRTKSPD